MFRPGEFVFDYIEGAEKGQIQPNGVDLRIDEVYTISNDYAVVFDERGINGLLYKNAYMENNYYVLVPHNTYVAVIKEKVKIPKDHIGLYFPRSSMFRMGIITDRALFDSGFVGYPRVLLFNSRTTIKIKRLTRIGQLSFVKAMHYKMYNGQYQESD